ncbi:sugar ABC transporter permease [Candidatus Poribacteria bacterium]|jgi:D-xylose transport system permease protein|nr:sugar ABC transporter permease [Candidatus Poribacteria bacterium]MBT5532573.1 sugar ABC transporter permease [Candidatus Poribacteria bacterium]MBT5710057.1 sugar ABC transporter permease [Candidatus Poribacteria bacterium]MBT7099936.1 sugar ABC transporter permease [Candidatus Poribacteria bacterium]MBT7808932.1 sugar ABC transporter permease [Candidatus Poribacteria bacterium]
MKRRHLQTYAMALSLVAIWALFAVVTDGVFLSSRNLLNLTRQASVTAILAIGMVVVIISGNIDLSVGSLAGFLGAGLAVSHGVFGAPGLASAALMVAVGAGLGCCHGLLVAYQRVPAFIVTLGGLMVYRGGMLAITKGGTPRLPMDSWLKDIGNGSLPQTAWGIPTPLVIVAILSVVMWLVVSRMRYGRHLHAVGGNAEAAFLSGIDTRRVVVMAFTMMGALAAVGGAVLTARVGSASPEAGRLLELDAIAACVIGGASLMGGRGSIPGALLGALVMGSLDNGMSLANMGPFWQDIVKGSVLVVAVWFDMRVRAR